MQTFVPDESAQDFQVLNAQQVQFTTNTPEAFVLDTPVKIQYSKQGDTTLTSTIVQKTVEDDEATVTLTVADNSFPLPLEGITIQRVSYTEGQISIYEFANATLGSPLKTGLSVACVPRSVTFLNKLLICNGVNRVLVWDGQTLEEVVDFVKEEAAVDFRRLGDTQFSFTLSPLKASLFDRRKYTNNNVIQLSSQGAITTTTVRTIVQADTLVTITTVDRLPAFNNPMALFYRDWPPAFSFMMVAHNRLWALGPGAVGLSYRDPDQALRLYFSYRSNTVSSWFNENTKTVPSINLAENHGSPDNLEAIAFVNNRMVILGRHKTQVWSGSEPLGSVTDPTRPPFQFLSLLPMGMVHGNLMIPTANDLYVVSHQGILSLSTLNVAKQFAATASDTVDPLVRQFVQSTTTSNQAYRACRAFAYPAGGFCGFKIGFNKVLVSLYASHLYAWSLFSGDFAKARAFLTDVDSALYLAVGNQLYQYADGIEAPPVYGDNDGQDLIAFLWTPPVVYLSGRRYANKRYELVGEYPSSFVLQPDNTVSLVIAGDTPKTFLLQQEIPLAFKGDPLGVSALVDPQHIGPNPNDPNAAALGFRLDEPYAFFKGRLKFISSRFTVSLTGATRSGPLVFQKIRLFGILERS